MQKGFLNQASKKNELGPLQDKRAKPFRPKINPNASGGGGWGTYEYKPTKTKPTTSKVLSGNKLKGVFQTNTTSTETTLSHSTITDRPEGQESEKQRTPQFKGPIVPQCIDQPKQAIQVWYKRKYKHLEYRANEYFQSWHRGPPHERYFTSIFTCPVTGEKFLSGTFGDKLSMMIQEEPVRRRQSSNEMSSASNEEGGDDRMMISVCWYRKKRDAEYAAAARALDSLTYREGNGQKHMSYGLCEEGPYLVDDDIDRKFLIPESAPEDIEDEVMVPVHLQLKECGEESGMDVEVEEDDCNKFRSDYRSIRKRVDDSDGRMIID